MEQTTTSTTTTDRPASMEAALASVEPSSGSQPESQPADPSTPAAAIAQPGTDGAETTEQPSTEPGTPPKWRWQDILANARETAAKEAADRAKAELEQQYSGLRDFAQIDAHERAGLLVWRRALSGDPQALSLIKQNPEAMQALKGLVAPDLQANDTEPEPDLETADGQPVYSAGRQKLREEWFKRQIRAEFAKELQPLQSVAQHHQVQARTAAYTTTTTSVIARMEAADPDFKTHKAKVGALISSDPRLSKIAIDDGDPETAIELAWARVYRSEVLPAKRQQSEAQVLTDLTKRAVAGTTNPAAATSATPKRPASMAEAMKQQGL